MKTRLTFLTLLLPLCLMAQAPPVLRQALTTNTAPVNPSNVGQIPIWQGTFWSFGTNLPGLIVTNMPTSSDFLWTNTTIEYLPTQTNTFGFAKNGGGLWVGSNTTSWWGSLAASDTLISFRDVGVGETANQNVVIASINSTNVDTFEFDILLNLFQIEGLMRAWPVSSPSPIDLLLHCDGNGNQIIQFSSNSIPTLYLHGNLPSYLNGTSSRLGILTNDPQSALHVRGAATIETGITNNGTYQHSVGAFTGALFVSSNANGVAYWTTNVNNIGVTNLSVYNNVIFNGSIISNFNQDLNWTNDGVVLKGTTKGYDPRFALRFNQLVGAGAQADYNLDTNVGKFSFAVGSNVLARGMGSVSFGNNNHVNTNANWSTISGGQTNVIGTNVQSAFIGGGGRNIIFGPGAYNSVITGGSNNLAQILNASDLGGIFIGGGGDHQATSNYCTIAGGFGNLNRSDYAFIGGGTVATLDAHSTRGVIVGGDNNNLFGAYGVVGGGLQNKAGSGTGNFAEYGVIGGGERNGISLVAATSSHAVIGGGQSNRVVASSDRTFIGGGHNNQVDQSTNGVIGGGYKNIVTSAHNGQILGGVLNIIDTANNAFIVGMSNRITANHAAVLGNRGTNSLAFSVDIAPNGNTNKATFTASNTVFRTSVATEPTAVITLTADNQVVDATQRSYVRLASNDATPSNRDFILTGTNVVQGARLVLEWTDGTNAGQLIDNVANSGAGNTRLSADWVPGQNDTLELIFNGTDWIQVSRADN